MPGFTNCFKEKGAFTLDANNKYSVNFKKMQQAINDLSKEILIIQGDGDYNSAKNMIDKYGVLTEQLKKDLDKINSKGIPLDIIFEQGQDVIGLK